jgi:predicted DNA-binding ribbon-helix-helix protein
MKSTIVKRSIVIAGHKTSISLEDAFWMALKEIANGRGTTLSNVVTSINGERQQGNLSSNIRQFVLDFYRDRLSARTGAQADQAEAGPSAGPLRPGVVL